VFSFMEVPDDEVTEEVDLLGLTDRKGAAA
jgi:hypothetical protein